MSKCSMWVITASCARVTSWFMRRVTVVGLLEVILACLVEVDAAQLLNCLAVAVDDRWGMTFFAENLASWSG